MKPEFILLFVNRWVLSLDMKIVLEDSVQM